MATTEDVLKQARDLVSARLADLDDERKRLERAVAELGGKVARRKPGRPRGSAASATSKASTRKGNGRRGRASSQLIKLLRLAKIAPESNNQAIADHLGVKHSTATAMVSKIKSQGLITRENKMLVVTGDGQLLLNDQPNPSTAKPASAKKATSSKAKKASPKRRSGSRSAKAKRGSSQKTAKSSSAKAAAKPKAKASGGSAAKAPAASGNASGEKAGDSASTSDPGKEGGGTNPLYDKK